MKTYNIIKGINYRDVTWKYKKSEAMVPWDKMNFYDCIIAENKKEIQLLRANAAIYGCKLSSRFVDDTYTKAYMFKVPFPDINYSAPAQAPHMFAALEKKEPGQPAVDPVRHTGRFKMVDRSPMNLTEFLTHTIGAVQEKYPGAVDDVDEFKKWVEINFWENNEKENYVSQACGAVYILQLVGDRVNEEKRS